MTDFNRVTVFANDKIVTVDGVTYTGVDCSSLGEHVSVIQWYGDHGEVEFNSVAGSRKFNEEIDDASCFMHIVAAAKAAPVPAKP